MQAQSRPVGVAYGECWCGCGRKTNVAPSNGPTRTKGVPYRYIVGHGRRMSGVEYLVEDRGYVTPCHVWQLKTCQLGYGRVTVRGGKSWTTKVAHKVYWEREHGPVPKGYELDHLCRQRDCVRVEHLELVTHAENVRRSPATKLTVEAVAIIRATPRTHGSGAALARQFGVSQQVISKVRNGTAWV